MKIWTTQLLSQLKNCKNSKFCKERVLDVSVFLINSFTVYDAALGYSFGVLMPEAEETTASRVFPVELY